MPKSVNTSFAEVHWGKKGHTRTMYPHLSSISIDFHSAKMHLTLILLLAYTADSMALGKKKYKGLQTDHKLVIMHWLMLKDPCIALTHFYAQMPETQILSV